MLTPMDIHNREFKKGFRGYSEEDVDTFMDQLAVDYEKVYREYCEMKETTEKMKDKLGQYEKMESTMNSTLMLAQETAENAGAVAEVAAEAGFYAHDRLNQMEATMAQVVGTMQQMSETLVGLRDLVTANAEATANQLQVQMRGPQPDDEPPAANHWLGRKLF